jgi:L-ascorbate metabolism protein UlaG (beta-lactamase superfamily)
MKVRWLGHAAFYLESPQGVRVVTDPFGSDVPYPPLDIECDIVTISHEHHDHNDTSGVKGQPKILRGLEENTGKFREITMELGDSSFRSLPSFHDSQRGMNRGSNAIFLMNLGGLKIAHMGDLGHVPDVEVIEALKGCDLLLIPVGGHFTIDGKTAAEVTKAISPKIVSPMHYLTPNISTWPIKGPEEFLQEWSHVKRLCSAEVEIAQESIPTSTEAWLFQI